MVHVTGALFTQTHGFTGGAGVMFFLAKGLVSERSRDCLFYMVSMGSADIITART